MSQPIGDEFIADAARVLDRDPADGVPVWSPGRINLIGDHIDYSGGFVMPMAIDRGTRGVVFARTDGELRGYSANFSSDGVVTASMDDLAFAQSRGWFNYIVSIVWALESGNLDAGRGFDIYLDGDIPNGAGLSSSASVEMAIAVALNDLGQLGLEPRDLALLGQRAENEYIGVASGIMDQLAIAAGVEGHALLMDCEHVTTEPVPMNRELATVVVTNTNQRRSLAGSEYNDRRAAVEQGAAIIGEVRGTPLAQPVDATLADLAAAEPQLRAAGVYPFIKHTITEQARVIAAAQALRSDDIVAFGELMRGSHESLAQDFKVTSPQLDALVESAWATPGVIGARMTGAGFGGCSINLIEPGAVETAVPQILESYRCATGITATAFAVTAGAGARVLSP